MVFEQIEKLKDEYTDKYVVVDDTRPELQRFSGLTGMVKTVNMSGRALVEFNRAPNIGWFDIDIDFLKVVDAPKEEEAPAKKAKKSPAKKPEAAASELEKARSGKPSEMSMEEMLAAARSNKPAAAKPKEAKPAAAGMSVDDILAAARKGGGQAEAKPEPKSDGGATPTGAAAQAMSVEEMLAAARGKKAPTAEAPAETTDAPAAEAPAEPADAEEAVTEAAPSAPSGDGVSAEDCRNMSVEDAVAFCRKTDG